MHWRVFSESENECFFTDFQLFGKIVPFLLKKQAVKRLEEGHP